MFGLRWVRVFVQPEAFGRLEARGREEGRYALCVSKATVQPQEKVPPGLGSTIQAALRCKLQHILVDVA